MAPEAPVRLVMLGPPGAGKGTQAERIARERGIPRISTGDILRSAALDQTEIGRAHRATMDAGRLVNDDVVIGIVRERLALPDAARGFVLDGFPRTLVQAETLDDILDHRAPLVVVDIEVPEETLVTRLSQRRICSVCGTTATAAAAVCAKCGGKLVQRTDDDLDVIRERLRVYVRDTRAIVEFYRRRPTFRSVDGDQAQELVAADIAAAIAAVSGVAR
jgi:adenylate kinase